MQNLKSKIKEKKWAIRLWIARRLYGNPAQKLKIIGVTGTNGKTTVAELLYKVSLSMKYKAGFIGTTSIMVGEKKLKMNRKIPTTPDSITLTKVFSQMVRAGCEYVFMEVSSHAMDQNRVAGIKFIGGIFTNLTQDHLDYHKSMESYFEAKKKFFKMLPEDAFALSNIDDEHGERVLEGTKAKKYFYGLVKEADFKGEITKLDFTGLDMKIGDILVQTKLLGRFNAYNLLAVYGATRLLNFSADKVLEILRTIEPPRGRFQYFISASGVVAVVDYAHSPDAVEKIITAIRDIKGNNSKIISVFGCGGDRDTLKRRIMGKIGATLSDLAIFTSDNPRNEDPEKIIAEMKTDLTMSLLEKVKTIADRREAIAMAVELAQSGDIILLAGKGHEDYQEIRGVKYPFNDMAEIKKVLK